MKGRSGLGGRVGTLRKREETSMGEMQESRRERYRERKGVIVVPNCDSEQ